jgi:hypothetical protein
VYLTFPLCSLGEYQLGGVDFEKKIFSKLKHFEIVLCLWVGSPEQALKDFFAPKTFWETPLKILSSCRKGPQIFFLK